MPTLINNFETLQNADNASGAPWFQVVKPADVDTIPDVVLDTIATAITLNSGATAYNIMPVVGSAEWTETPNTTEGRQSYTSVFSFVIPKDRADVLNYAKHLNNKGVIAIVRDANGQSRLMGTKEAPATFRMVTRTLGNQQGARNEHRYEIALVSDEPVPFYQVTTHLPAPANVCPTVYGVSLAVSDSTPDFGDTVTLTATTSGFTGTVTYYFAVLNNLGFYERIEQVADNTYDYVCSYAGSFGVEVVAMDGSGNKAVGFATLTVTWQLGRAIDLNGTTQSVETIDNQFSNIVNCKNWILGFWFNADSLANSPIIISGNETDFYIQIRTTDIRFRCTLGNTKTFTTSISTGTNYNVLLYRDDVGDNVKLYLNGVEITTTSGTSGENPQLGTKFTIGDYPVGGFEFNGKVTHLFCIQGFTISSAQALAFYNSGNGKHPYFLIDKYPDWYIDFQDNVTDQGSRGYDCQLVNSPSYANF